MADEPAPETKMEADLIEQAEALVANFKKSGLPHAGAVLAKHFAHEGIEYIGKAAGEIANTLVEALFSTHKNGKK